MVNVVNQLMLRTTGASPVHMVNSWLRNPAPVGMSLENPITHWDYHGLSTAW